MHKRILTLATIHGDTDKAAAHKRHAESEVLSHVAEEARTPGPATCEVVAVFKGENGDRLELAVTDWAEAAALEVGQTYRLTPVLIAED